jgi:hypothetical protein
MKRYALSLVFCLLTASGMFGQTKPSVEGVWKVAEVIPPRTKAEDKGTTANAPRTSRLPSISSSNPETGLLIFTKGYYSAIGVEGREARAAIEPAKDPKNLTDAEKIARYEQWKPFIANAGTYEIKEVTISMRATVAKNQNRTGSSAIWEFKLEDPNTLWLIPTGNAAAAEPRVKLTRLE